MPDPPPRFHHLHEPETDKSLILGRIWEIRGKFLKCFGFYTTRLLHCMLDPSRGLVI